MMSTSMIHDIILIMRLFLIVLDSDKLINPSLSFQSQFLRTLSQRGFIHQCTDFEGLDKLLSTEVHASAYLGFDATAKSLHVGSLLQIMVLRLLQKAGHKPVILIGSILIKSFFKYNLRLIY